MGRYNLLSDVLFIGDRVTCFLFDTSNPVGLSFSSPSFLVSFFCLAVASFAPPWDQRSGFQVDIFSFHLIVFFLLSSSPRTFFLKESRITIVHGSVPPECGISAFPIDSLTANCNKVVVPCSGLSSLGHASLPLSSEQL